MATKKTYIEHDGQRYELYQYKRREICSDNCSFRRIDGKDECGKPDYCTKKCYLPKWFQDLQITTDAWLKEASEPCANADHRKQRGRTAPTLALKKGRTKR